MNALLVAGNPSLFRPRCKHFLTLSIKLGVMPLVEKTCIGKEIEIKSDPSTKAKPSQFTNLSWEWMRQAEQVQLPGLKQQGHQTTGAAGQGHSLFS